MSWNYSTIGDFVNQSDIARKAIISSCNSIGFSIPTDEEREEIKADKIRLSEIPNWMYQDVGVYATTLTTKKYQLNSSLKSNFPDLTVDWGDGSTSAVSECPTNIIVHEYLSSGQYPIRYMSKKIDKLTDSAFNGDKNITTVNLSPTITTIGDYAFYYAENLTSITGYDNVQSIGGYAFRGSSLKNFSLPDNLTSIGNEAFTACPLQSFNISKTSNLEEIGNASFRMIQTKEIFIPKKCQFLNSNPFQGSTLKVSVDVQNPYYVSDAYGCVFQKDQDGNNSELVHIPAYSRYFSHGYEFPSQMKKIQTCSMDRYNTVNINNASEAEIIKIGKNVEHIHPYYIGDGSQGSCISVDSRNLYYGTGEYGEIYTWRNVSDIGDVSKRNAIFQIYPQTETDLSIPEYCSQIFDFESCSLARVFSNWSTNIVSKLQNVYINYLFPETIVLIDPQNGFFYLNGTDCLNYSIYNRQLYRKIGSNDYASLVKVPKNDTDITINEKCYNLEQYCCQYSMANALNLENISGYVPSFAFSFMPNIQRIQFGNGITGMDGHMYFTECSRLSSIIIGTDENSKLYNLKATAFIDYPMPKMKNIVIYSPNVSTNIDSTFFRITGTPVEIDLYIPIWKKDSNGKYTSEHTSTYQKFYAYGLNETTRNINNGCLIKDISCWNG